MYTIKTMNIFFSLLYILANDYHKIMTIINLFDFLSVKLIFFLVKIYIPVSNKTIKILIVYLLPKYADA